MEFNNILKNLTKLKNNYLNIFKENKNEYQNIKNEFSNNDIIKILEFNTHKEFIVDLIFKYFKEIKLSIFYLYYLFLNKNNNYLNRIIWKIIKNKDYFINKILIDFYPKIFQKINKNELIITINKIILENNLKNNLIIKINNYYNKINYNDLIILLLKYKINYNLNNNKYILINEENIKKNLDNFFNEFDNTNIIEIIKLKLFNILIIKINKKIKNSNWKNIIINELEKLDFINQLKN